MARTLLSIMFLLVGCGPTVSPSSSAAPPTTSVDDKRSAPGAAYVDDLGSAVEAACACDTVACAVDRMTALSKYDDLEPHPEKDPALEDQVGPLIEKFERCLDRQRLDDERATLRALLDKLCACSDDRCRGTLASRAYNLVNDSELRYEYQNGRLDAEWERLNRCGKAGGTSEAAD